jgi:hypothetical protein
VAIIGINPGRAPQQQPQERPVSDIDKIFKALQVANAGLGVAVNFQKIRDLEASRVRTERITPTDEQAGRQIEADIGVAESQRNLRAAQAGKTERETEGLPTRAEAVKLRMQESTQKIKENRQKVFDSETKLRKEYMSDPITKATRTIRAATNQVRDLANAEQSAASQHSLIFKYMKSVDPGSTVKEGEFNTVEKAGSAFERMSIGLLNRTFEGKFLTDTQVADFLKASEINLQAQEKAQAGVDQNYKRLASEQGFSPANVVFEQQKKKPPPKNDDPSGIRNFFPDATDDSVSKIEAIMRKNRRLKKAGSQ